MLATSDTADLLKTEFYALPLAEVLQKPPTVLLGVTEAAGGALAGIGVKTVFDLALSRVFQAAVQLDDAADNQSSAFTRFGAPATDMVRPDLPGGLRVNELRFQPVDILSGITDAEAFRTALGVLTVRDLAVYPPYLGAKSILDRVFFPERGIEFDPESPADLVPKSGEYPTERVQYTTLLLDEIKPAPGAPALTDIGGVGFTPVDMSPVADENWGFKTIGTGALLTFNQSWFMQGVTLGHLLHSMALAPGESTRIAVVDWSRKSQAGQTEAITETEALSQDTSHNRSISEVTEAVASETQSGFSSAQSDSTTNQSGGASGLDLGIVAFGGSSSTATTTTSAESYSTTAGQREIGASMLQQVNDRTHQNAHAARTRRASVVREVSQSEHEEVSTRVITNYNHMHSLTVQYYEVLQAYRVETSVVRADRVVFVPFRLVNFANENILLRFRAALIRAALTSTVRDALLNYDTLELAPDRDVRFPVLGGSIKDSVTKAAVVGPDPPPPPPPGDAPTPTPGPVSRAAATQGPVSAPALRQHIAMTLWAAEATRLANIVGGVQVRRGLESLFLPADVKILDGEVRAPGGQTISLVVHRHDGTHTTDLQGAAVTLSDVERLALAGSHATADVEATTVLTLVRNGIVFPLELPAVTVVHGSAETKLLQVKAAGADVNLRQHLMDNRLYYTQAVLRALDAAMVASLLSRYSMTLNGQTVPLVQVAEPKPVRIVGNYLAFRINSDPARDQEWRDWMASRGITLGQAKVDLIPLSSGGVFGEAVLGRFNCAEKLDLTRFWNWQDSPIPIQPSDIAAIQTGSRATAEDVRPGSLSAPIVNITPPTALPEPVGMASILAAIQNGNMFRDMSGLAETVKLAQEAIKASAAGATAAGAQAAQNLATVMEQNTQRLRIAADLLKGGMGAPGTGDGKAPPGKGTVSERGGELNEAYELDKLRNGESGAGSGAGGDDTLGASRPSLAEQVLFRQQFASAGGETGTRLADVVVRDIENEGDTRIAGPSSRKGTVTVEFVDTEATTRNPWPFAAGGKVRVLISDRSKIHFRSGWVRPDDTGRIRASLKSVRGDTLHVKINIRLIEVGLDPGTEEVFDEELGEQTHDVHLLTDDDKFVIRVTVTLGVFQQNFTVATGETLQDVLDRLGLREPFVKSVTGDEDVGPHTATAYSGDFTITHTTVLS